MEDEYREVVKEFYKVYRPLQKRYNLRSHMHFSVYADGIIEIWEYMGETQKKRICKIKEVTEIDCYKRAIEYLKIYGREKEEKENKRNTAVAV